MKYKLIDMNTEKVVCNGFVEKIGEENAEFFHKNSNGHSIHECFYNVYNHNSAFEHIKNALLDKEYGAIKNINEIFAIGHRVVHGGEYFKGPTLIDENVIKKIESLIPLAPLHNKASLYGIKGCFDIFKNNIPQVAVFDTSFYTNIEPCNYIYPIPYKYYEKYKIRKYGFHGTSHQFVSLLACKILKKDIKNLKIISCHLGNGSSITAIKNGVAIDTSMGLTPLGGIMMGTRSGSLDPSVVIEMAKRENISLDKLGEILNKDSGLKGISGLGNDDRKILLAEKSGDYKAKLSHKMMINQIIKYIGGYMAILQGCDAIIFTGGIGENQWMHREKICENFSFMGLYIDNFKNQNIKIGKISSENSKVDVLVIPTDEELAIARFTLNLLYKEAK